MTNCKCKWRLGQFHTITFHTYGLPFIQPRCGRRSGTGSFCRLGENALSSRVFVKLWALRNARSCQVTTPPITWLLLGVRLLPLRSPGELKREFKIACVVYSVTMIKHACRTHGLSCSIFNKNQVPFIITLLFTLQSV